MAEDLNAPAGWYQDPIRPGKQRYWDGDTWLAPAGWYRDPYDARSKRRWSGNSWEAPRRARVSATYVGAGVLVMFVGTAALWATSSTRVGPAFDPESANRPWCEWIRSHASEAVTPQMWAWWVLIVVLLVVAVALYLVGGEGRRGIGWLLLMTTVVPGAVAAVLAFPPVLIAVDRMGNCLY